MSAAAREQAAAARRAAALFRLPERAVLAVAGADRVRWLDGMVSNDVAGLAAGRARSGCYATLLTRKGRLVADLHVLLRESEIWLELEAGGAAAAREALERFVVADDVALREAGEIGRLGLEGPAAPAVLAELLGSPLELAPDACCEVELAGVPTAIARYGFGGLPALQLFPPRGNTEAVAAAVLAAGAELGLAEAGAEALEILRIEAGTPRLGAELDGDVLPAEARLEHAISPTKGCYTGQEIVARLASRGHVNHLLVGLRFAAPVPPAPGSAVELAGKAIGEITSSCLSPAAGGAIALGYVRVPHDAPGTRVAVGGGGAEVCALPFTGDPRR